MRVGQGSIVIPTFILFMRMQRTISLFFLLGVFALLQAQPNEAIMARILRQLQVYPQEKTYIHTDGTDYSCGDRVWLKVYLVNALSHEAVSESRYVYVELISPQGVMLSRVKLISRDGIYAGYMNIPSEGIAGRYRLKAYTDLMTNVPLYESSKVIYVSGSKAEVAPPHSIEPTTEVQGDDKLLYVKDNARIKVTTRVHGKPLYLVAHCRAYPFYVGSISPRRPIVFMADSIPQGVISLLLVDAEMNILAERLFFSDNGAEQCRLEITPYEASPSVQDTAMFKLNIPHLRPNERADISVSLRRIGSWHRHQPSSILAQFFLASDVTHGLEEAEALYGRTDRVDSLLRYRKWQRYDMQKVLKGQTEQPVVARETSNLLSGKVRSLVLKKPVQGATVHLISPQTGIYANAVTDKQGRFVFNNMDYPERTEYVLHAMTAKGNDRIELVMDEKDYPDDARAVTQAGHEVFEVMPDDAPAAFQKDAIVLDNVDVTAKVRNSAGGGDVYAQLADFSFGLKEIAEMDATCLHEVIRRIPGVFIRENQCYIRASSTINENHPAAIAIDGVFVESDYDLDNIQMQDVAKVDVFKAGTTAIWGTRGGSGVISITTKVGNYHVDDAIARLSQKKLAPLGYQRYVKFESTMANRKTVYWNPHVTTDVLRIANKGNIGRCVMVVEGVTTEGRLIHEEKIVSLP